MKPVRIALIGNRHDHSVPNFNSLKNHPEYFEIVGVADLIPGKDEAVYAGYPVYTVDELLAMDDLEAVMIESGKEYEVIDAQKFADKGIPVFLDKPGSSDIPRYEKFLATMKAKGLPVGYGYVYRYNLMVKQALELLEAGELGEIVSVEAHMSVRHDTNKREWLGRYKGGMLFFLGCHLIDMVCLFAGFPEEIIPLSCATGNEGLDSEDFGCVVFKYKNGASFIKTNASEYNGFDRRQLVISGTKGTVEIRPMEIHCEGGQYTEAKITLASDKPQAWADSSKLVKSDVYDRYAPMLIDFAKMVRGEMEMVNSYEYELELMKTIVKACGADEEVFVGEPLSSSKGKEMKRTLALLLALLTASSVSCGGSGAPTETDAPDSSEVTTEAPAPEFDLPVKDFGGREFNIIGYSLYDDQYVDRESLTGDILDDAIYERNRKIEDDYNIKIVPTIFSHDVYSGAELLKKSVAASDNSVDLAFNNSAQSTALALGGYLSELGSLPEVDLAQPWWDKGSIESLSVGGKNYFAANSLCILTDNLTSVIFFNRDLAKDYGLGDLYETVRAGKWTYPAMYEMSKAVSSDLNGSGTPDDKDRYGLLADSALMTEGICDCGELILEKNSSDLPEIAIGSPKSEEMAEFFYNMLADRENVMVCERYQSEYSNVWNDLLYPSFMEGRGLFLIGFTQCVLYFRGSEVNYGILPRPKFDESQERYYSHVSYFWADMVNVPSAVTDPECCGLILEALAAESLKSVTTASYEVTIVNKQLRDEESKEMLELANGSRIYDFGQFASGMTGLNSKLQAMALSAESYTFSSIVDANRDALQSGIDSFIEGFAALDS